jgi:HlyD family secretion protein
MSPSWRRRLITAVVGALFAASLVYAFWPQPVAVDLGAVTRGPLRVTVDDEGRTRVREVYVVSAPLAGRVLRIDSHVGDPVTAGDTVLATIEPNDPTFLDRRSQTEAEAAVKAAEAAKTLAAAELMRTRAELEYANAELKRARTLATRGNISQSSLDRAELEHKTRRAGVASAEAALKVRTFELETARARLIVPGGDRVGRESPACCVQVRAPESGRVLRVLHESAGVVLAGTPLLEIGDPRDLEIVVDLLSTDAVKIAEGAQVIVEDWGGGAILAGRVRRVEPYGFTKVSALGIEEQRVNVIIDFADPPEKWRPLGHGYRVETRIVVWHGADVLGLPLSALFRDGDAWAVFVSADGIARLRRVAIGHRNSRRAEAVDGIQEGERVVLHPSDRVEDGTRIVPRP